MRLTSLSTPSGTRIGSRQRRLGGSPEIVRDDSPILQRDDSIGSGSQFRVVSDQHHRAAVVTVEADQQLDDLASGGGIKIAGWLVRQQDRWPIGEGSRQRHPLLFTAGKLNRIVTG